MYLRTIYLFSFSLLISFYFINYFKRVVIKPESALENSLYQYCSPLVLDSHKIILDFDVTINKKDIQINVRGLKENYLFSKSVDEIYKKIKRKAFGKEITISVMGQDNECLYSKVYKK